ncbi:response regulator transcription factor [Mycolicibacterium llatzerense]
MADGVTQAAQCPLAEPIPGSGRLRAVVVDDRRPVVGSLAHFMQREQFVVHVTSSVDDTVQSALDHDPDVVVVDLAVPGLDAFEVCRQLRSVTNAYLVVLSARQRVLDDIGEPVAADVFIADPISPRELVARLRAMMRRPRSMPDTVPAASVKGSSRASSGLRIDVPRRRAHSDGIPLALTRIEFDVLAALAARPGVVLTRRQLVAAVWGDSRPISRALVEAHIGGLRRKLGDDPAAPRYVSTVRGSGYRLATS